MTYLGEFRANWRYAIAASIGMAAGYLLVNYIGNVFTPHLIKELGFSRSDIALVGATSFLGILGQPIVGRLVDAFGVRLTAMVGVICAPLIFLGLSAMTGSLIQYFLLSLVQVTVVGGTTASVVYTRLIAQRFDRARGIALAIAACAAPATATLSIPFLSEFIDVHGWRAGYMLLAACVAVAGALAMLLIPAGTGARRSAEASSVDRKGRYRVIIKSPAFLFIITGVILCNLSWTMQTSQLKVLLLDRGVDAATGAMAISLYPLSVIGGRLLCGLCLDRFPTYAVVALSMGLPCLGLGILLTGSTEPSAIAAAVLVLGLSQGAEGDVLAYAVMRYFALEIYSTVFGLVLGALALSVSVGSLLLSYTLKITEGSFTPFMILGAIAALLGAAMFMMLKRIPIVS
jgi:MFS family permease